MWQETPDRSKATPAHAPSVLFGCILRDELGSDSDIDTKLAHPTIPWREIAGVRSAGHLVHAYFDIDLRSCRVRCGIPPGSCRRLEPLIPPEAV